MVPPSTVPQRVCLHGHAQAGLRQRQQQLAEREGGREGGAGHRPACVMEWRGACGGRPAGDRHDPPSYWCTPCTGCARPQWDQMKPSWEGQWGAPHRACLRRPQEVCAEVATTLQIGYSGGSMVHWGPLAAVMCCSSPVQTHLPDCALRQQRACHHPAPALCCTAPRHTAPRFTALRYGGRPQSTRLIKLTLQQQGQRHTGRDGARTAPTRTGVGETWAFVALEVRVHLSIEQRKHPACTASSSTAPSWAS